MNFAEQGYEYLYSGDFDRALESFRKGAEENDAESCWGIVELYESGKPKDQKARKRAEDETIEMCVRAASLGHAKAEYKLSCMRKKDRPIEVTSLDDFRMNSQNRQEHADYVQKAEVGDPRAWEEVGMDYLLGLGVERDTDKAYECFQKGGAGTEAWEHIGGCYLHGVGCEKNVDRAVECYRKAADLGSTEAKASLRGVIEMEKSIVELAAKLLIKNQNASHNSTITVKDESGNLFTFLFYGTGYNEYHQYSFKCQSDLFERPIGFSISTIAESIDMDDSGDMEYDSEMVSKHEKTLSNAIELALTVEPAKWQAPYEKQSWW